MANKEESSLVLSGAAGKMRAGEILDSIVDAETARNAEQDTERLRKMLELAEQYGQYAKQYCSMEAEVYVRIASIDGAEALLTTKSRNLVRWIRSKDEHELAEIVAECATGRRIKNIYNAESRANLSEVRQRLSDKEYQRISKSITDELANEGTTTLSVERFIDEWTAPSEPDRATAKAYVEKTRDMLLKGGGVGIADGQGTYVDPKSTSRKKIAAAIQARLESIYNDIRSIAAICNEANFSVPHEGLKMIYEQLELLEEAS